MIGWHHQLNEHVFEQTPGNGEGQGSLVCCSSQGCKESDTSQQLNNKWLYKNSVTSHYSHGTSTHPKRRSRRKSGMKHFVLWKNWQNKPSDSCYFQEKSFFVLGFFPLPILRKALKSLTEITHQEHLLRCLLDCMRPSAKITDRLTFPRFRAAPQSYCRGRLPGSRPQKDSIHSRGRLPGSRPQKDSIHSSDTFLFFFYFFIFSNFILFLNFT